LQHEERDHFENDVRCPGRPGAKQQLGERHLALEVAQQRFGPSAHLGRVMPELCIQIRRIDGFDGDILARRGPSRCKHPFHEVGQRGNHRNARTDEERKSSVENAVRARKRQPEDRLEHIAREIRQGPRGLGGERLSGLRIEKDIAGAHQVLVQLGMPKKAIARESRHPSHRAARASLFVRHDLEPLVGRGQNAPLDGDPSLEVSQRLTQRARCLHPPVDALDVPAGVPEDLQDLLAEPNGLNPRLPGGMHGFVESTAGELRLDHRLRGRLRILDIEIEEPQVKIACFTGRPQNRATRRMERVEQQPEFQRMPVRKAVAVDERVLLAKGTAGITIVTQTAKNLVEHLIVALGRDRYACGRVHRSENRLEDTGDDLAIRLGLEPESIDDDIEHAQSQRQPIVVSEVRVTHGIAPPHAVEGQGMKQNAQPAREIGGPLVVGDGDDRIGEIARSLVIVQRKAEARLILGSRPALCLLPERHDGTPY